ncbi:calpain-9-like isoform X3 [Branchiostoma floridae]|uniref:Calpain-9-like isoform X3 n=1 Tax=Branchiostoma floridae TaxID=7739 RepID=A0A9J7MMF3_BRAFL|nr:calpain-9-like isoform X3 [Branchiostoma floridae]
MATPEEAVPFKGQVYAEIKDENQGGLWEDPEFPAEDQSLYFSNHENLQRYNFKWMRPGEIVGNPEFIDASEGASRFDVCQGCVGDCWMLAATATLAQKPYLFKRVCCEDNSYSDDYCGAFHFRFWQYGEWVDVVIDDRIPMVVFDWGDPQYFSLHSNDKNEFWSALLEKAYAKLHGSYESLEGGHTSDALVDFTGGMTERYDTTDPSKLPGDLYKILQKAFERGSTMGCSGIKGGSAGLEAIQDNGLVQQHAYSITGFAEVEGTQLVRIRNPWGKTEWKGPWGDQSDEWNGVDEGTKEELGIVQRDDGEFWMSFEDFLTYWKNIEICNLTPDSMGDDDDDKLRWNVNNMNGRWIKNESAGGCANFRQSSFAANPQFKVNLTDADDGDDDDMASCLVSLLQKDRRKQKHLGKTNLFLGFYMYEAKGRSKLKRRDVMTEAPVASSGSYINYRERSEHFKVTPGEYIVLPTTFNPNEEGEFILRVFTEKEATADEIDEGDAIIKQDKPKPPKEEWSDEKKDKFRAFFEMVAGLSGDDEEVPAIDPFELKSLFDCIFKDPSLTIDLCKDVIQMFDADGSGKIEYEEFDDMWDTVEPWLSAFKNSDYDKSGKLSVYELQEALEDIIGFYIPKRLLCKLAFRYVDEDGHISGGNFLRIAMRLHWLWNQQSGEAEDDGAGGFALNMGGQIGGLLGMFM